MPKGVKEFGSCKATTKIVLFQIKQILCLVIHTQNSSSVIKVNSFVKIVSLVYFSFCLLVCLFFIIIDRWTEATAFHLLAPSECFVFRRLKPSKADNRTTHCRRHYQTCKSLLGSCSCYLFPSHRPPHELSFLSPQPPCDIKRPLGEKTCNMIARRSHQSRRFTAN